VTRFHQLCSTLKEKFDPKTFNLAHKDRLMVTFKTSSESFHPINTELVANRFGLWSNNDDRARMFTV